jgi:2-C-methyl-D-erythritol 2,4-cyclodiphosphate synthase
MSSYISYMKTNLGSDLNTQENKISIKSTTSKQISAIGRKEGIACQAIVMLLKNL